MECLTGKSQSNYCGSRGYLACQAAPRSAFMEIVMKRIPLTNGYFAIVDDEDYESVSRFKWYSQRHGDCDYACCLIYMGHVGGTQKNAKMKMHQLIMRPPVGLEVDHRNQDGLDNTRGNLRLCTRAQNCMNRRSRKATSSIYKGVCWFKNNRKWCARIWVGGRNIRLGMFVDEIKAARAYNAAAKQYHGEFAWLNPV